MYINAVQENSSHLHHRTQHLLASFLGSFSEKSLVQTVCACSICPTFLGQLDILVTRP